MYERSINFYSAKLSTVEKMGDAAKKYLYEKRIPQLFESLMTALMHHQPEDHITFLQHCLEDAKHRGGEYTWDMFVGTSGASQPSGQADHNSREQSVRETDESPTRHATVPDESLEVQKMASKPIIFVLGGPGSGKGTQCSRIVEDFGFTHLSAGDLLRQEVARGTPGGQEVQEIMRQGKLVPPEVTVRLLKEAILSSPGSEGFLIDGFPRELSQGKIFIEQVYDCTVVLVFECSEEVMVGRLVERGRTSGRVDDNEETIRKRLHTFQQSTLPVIEHYQASGRVRKINSDRSVEEVYADVNELFKELTGRK